MLPIEPFFLIDWERIDSIIVILVSFRFYFPPSLSLNSTTHCLLTSNQYLITINDCLSFEKNEFKHQMQTRPHRFVHCYEKG